LLTYLVIRQDKQTSPFAEFIYWTLLELVITTPVECWARFINGIGRFEIGLGSDVSPFIPS
jgi:hypothetical protein